MNIDGKDLSIWGAVLLEGSYNSLFKYPKRKPVAYRNYADRDGITPDLRRVEYEPKQVALNFLIKHKTTDEFWSKYQSFFSDMIATGYRVMDLGNGLIHTLRYDKTTKLEPIRLFNSDGATGFTLNFLEDNHSIPDIQIPTGGISLKGRYEVNGIDFGDFGIHPDGEIGNVLRYPDVKEPFANGKEYDLGTRRLKHKEITIPLWMLANSKKEFITNYSAFFQQFNRTGEQSLYIKEIGGTTYAYYVDCPSYTVHWGSRFGAKFSIKIIVPVVTWLDGTTNIYTVLKDIDLGFIADEQGRVIVFNR